MTPVSKPHHLHQPGTKKCRAEWDGGVNQGVNVKFVVVTEDDLEDSVSDLESEMEEEEESEIEESDSDQSEDDESSKQILSWSEDQLELLESALKSYKFL